MPDIEAQPDRFISKPPAEFFVTMKISKTSPHIMLCGSSCGIILIIHFIPFAADGWLLTDGAIYMQNLCT